MSLVPHTGSYRTVKMNAKLWNSCTDPKTLVKFLEEDYATVFNQDSKPIASDRQCKLIALEVLRQARDRGWYSSRLPSDPVTIFENWIETGFLPVDAGWLDVSGTRKKTGLEIMSYLVSSWGNSWGVSDEIRIAIIREVVVNPNILDQVSLCGRAGNRYQSTCTECQTILNWRDRLIPTMSEAIYQERRWEDLPILADALSDAGCDVPQILDHLRNDSCPDCGGEGGWEQDTGGVTQWDQPISEWIKCETCKTTGKVKPFHCRGCWAVDLSRGIVP